jgi:hypothetical protein
MPHDPSPLRVAAESAWPDGREDCFSDDVVIDFPAVGPIVERMRRSFLGGAEPGATSLTAVLRLTARQATMGGRVPVDLHVRTDCVPCGGRGEVWDEPCGRCAGSGAGTRRQVVEIDVPSGVRDGACFAISVSAPFTQATRVRLRVSVC